MRAGHAVGRAIRLLTGPAGLGPAVATITALRAMGVTNGELVRYATSADASGDTSSVVGYAAIVWEKKP